MAVTKKSAKMEKYLEYGFGDWYVEALDAYADGDWERCDKATKLSHFCLDHEADIERELEDMFDEDIVVEEVEIEAAMIDEEKPEPKGKADAKAKEKAPLKK